MHTISSDIVKEHVYSKVKEECFKILKNSRKHLYDGYLSSML